MTSHKRATLAQVASVAGVSRSTASYALNDRKAVSEQTKAKVLAAAARLGYRVDSNARSLRGNRTVKIGVLLMQADIEMVNSPHRLLFWPRFIYSFIQTCSQAGCVVSYASQDRVQELIDSGIDMLVFQGVNPPDILEGIDIPYGLPILAMAPVNDRPASVVGHDVAAIANAVVEHAKQQGASHLGWMIVPEVLTTLGHWDPALEKACSQADLTYSYSVLDRNLQNLEQEVQRLLEAGVDAFFAIPGSLGRLLEALTAAGRSVPDDVLVITQGEGLVESLSTPPVTNLSLCAQESGTKAAQIVLAQVQTGEINIGYTMPFDLQVRESSTR